MTELDPPSASCITIIRVPFKIRRRGAHTVVVPADGADDDLQPEATPDCGRRENPLDASLLAALVKAFRWKRLIEDGRYGSPAELAKFERVDPAWVSRTLRLTLLDPDIVERVLNGDMNAKLTAANLMDIALTMSWMQQRKKIDLRS